MPDAPIPGNRKRRRRTRTQLSEKMILEGIRSVTCNDGTGQVCARRFQLASVPVSESRSRTRTATERSSDQELTPINKL